MSIAGEDVRDGEVLHYNHGGEIHEGNVGFVVVLLPKEPGAAELVSSNVNELMRADIHSGQHGVDKPLRLVGRHRGVQVSDDFTEHKICRDVPASNCLQSFMLRHGAA